jgi:transcriptional regulator with XRE-family HTH domain
VVDGFGTGLRQWREAAGWSQLELARRVPISQASLSRYEHDQQAVDLATAERLDDLLNTGGALKATLTTDAMALVLTPDDRARIAHSAARPSRVDAVTVAKLGDVLAAQRRLDDTAGPRVILPAVTEQMTMVTTMLRDARGPHRDVLAEVASEYVQFAGWLRAEIRHDEEAVRLLTLAVDLADDLDSGPLAAQAVNFKGWLARQQGRPRAVARWFLTAYHTPGAHVAQRIGDAAQAAQGYADLGERDEALRLLGGAEDLLDAAGDDVPPGTAYWLSPTFHHLNIGIARLALREYRAAADHIAAGLSGLPADQVDASWTAEYRDALKAACAAA